MWYTVTVVATECKEVCKQEYYKTVFLIEKMHRYSFNKQDQFHGFIHLMTVCLPIQQLPGNGVTTTIVSSWYVPLFATNRAWSRWIRINQAGPNGSNWLHHICTELPYASLFVPVYSGHVELIGPVSHSRITRPYFDSMVKEICNFAWSW